MAVGVAIWFQAGLTKSREVKTSGRLWKKLGISRKSAYRGLASLEGRKLVKVERHRPLQMVDGETRLSLMAELDVDFDDEGESESEVRAVCDYAAEWFQGYAWDIAKIKTGRVESND